MPILLLLVICFRGLTCGAPREGAGSGTTTQTGQTVLGISGSRFMVNGRTTFLLGISYYGGLGAPEELIKKDLTDLQQHGFNWLRLWATWVNGGNNVSAVDHQGRGREPFLSKLKWLVAECDRRGLVVDVTLTRGKGSSPRRPSAGLPDFAAHRYAVDTLVTALKPYGNWYLDLANEHDVHDGRYVPAAELKTLREQVRTLDSGRLVTASFGGHDLTQEDLREALIVVGVDFLCPHRPREANSPERTEAQTRSCLGRMKDMGRMAPVHYQEPFRRGYDRWEPSAADFLADLRGALTGGAAGWCFHNGQQNGLAGSPLPRSFDLRNRRLFDQFDGEEQKVVTAAGAIVGSNVLR